MVSQYEEMLLDSIGRALDGWTFCHPRWHWYEFFFGHTISIVLVAGYRSSCMAAWLHEGW